MLAPLVSLSMSQDLKFCSGWHCKLEACSQNPAYGWMGNRLLLAFIVLGISSCLILHYLIGPLLVQDAISAFSAPDDVS
jgi:hypothetical protein